jgi:hypothetical protein
LALRSSFMIRMYPIIRWFIIQSKKLPCSCCHGFT